MIIEKVNNGTYSQCRIPGIVATEKGTLLAYYECRKTSCDWADIDIKIIRSTDDGNTWNTVKLYEGNGITLNNPVMIVKGDEIHLLFLQSYKKLFHCKSLDDGITFSDLNEIKFDCDFFYSAFAIGPGHGIVHNGKMLVPVWFAQNKEDPFAHRPSVVATLFSDDGEKWNVGEVIGEDILVNPSECALAIASDNKVLISIRNENSCRKRAFAVSDDGASNWSEALFNEQIPDPVCMGSMCFDNQKIYHINCESTTERENLTVKISTDRFKTFEKVFVDTPAGYSDIAIKNDKLYILYERDCNNGGLYFKKISL